MSQPAVGGRAAINHAGEADSPRRYQRPNGRWREPGAPGIIVNRPQGRKWRWFQYSLHPAEMQKSSDFYLFRPAARSATDTLPAVLGHPRVPVRPRQRFPEPGRHCAGRTAHLQQRLPGGAILGFGRKPPPGAPGPTPKKSESSKIRYRISEFDHTRHALAAPRPEDAPRGA